MDDKAKSLSLTLGILLAVSVIGWIAFYTLAYSPLTVKSDDQHNMITQLQSQIAMLETQQHTASTESMGSVESHGDMAMESQSLGEILFYSGYSYLTPAAEKQLDDIALQIKSNTEARIHVIGHADAVRIGDKLMNKYPSNWELSVDRSMITAQYLLNKTDLKMSQFIITGLSYEEPKTANDTREGRAENRRAEIRIVQ